MCIFSFENIVCAEVPTCMQIGMCIQLDAASIGVLVTIKPVLSDHTKKAKKQS